MQFDYNGNKGFRLLSMYDMLNKGEMISKTSLASRFNVTPKTIQRDLDALRVYIADAQFSFGDGEIKYDRAKCGYYLVRTEDKWLIKEEILVVCKILLESRAFCKEELNRLIYKLLEQMALNDRKIVGDMIRNEMFCYIQLKHGKEVISTIWKLSQYITKHEIIQIVYRRMDGTKKEHKVKPVGVMFSEYYFYLISYMADGTKDYPTVFRVDRLEGFKGMNEKFEIPYKKRFSEGEFRKRVQFMYSGELRKVMFEYSGPSIEAVLDRLPTAKIISEKEGVCLVTADVYGIGIDIWLKGQGDYIKSIKEMIV